MMEIRNMKILLVSHAPWRNTGYGAPVDTISKVFISLGHSVYIMAIDGKTSPGTVKWALPGQNTITRVFIPPDNWGEAVIDEFCAMLGIDLIVSFFDPWVLKEGYDVPGVPWWAWFPVDQAPLPWGLEDSLGPANRKFVFSQWGAYFVPGAKAMFIPIAGEYERAKAIDKLDAKRMFGLQEGKTFLFNGPNLLGDRKNLKNTLKGFALYKQRGGQGRLVINTSLHGPIDVIAMVNNLSMAEHIIPISSMTRLYALDKANHAALLRATDVLVHPSAAEGFGLVIAEAMATGTPVIVGGNTSQPEVLGIGSGFKKGGIIIDDVTQEVAPQGGFWHRPTVEGIASALEVDLSEFSPEFSAVRFTFDESKALWEKEFETA